MISTYVAIGMGGAIGAISRYSLGKVFPTNILTHFPLQIFLVNALGCFFMGMIVEYMALKWSPSFAIKSFITTGFLGGFTTFSAFTLEFALLIDKNLPLHAIIYAVSSVLVNIFCFFAGVYLVRFIFPSNLFTGNY